MPAARVLRLAVAAAAVATGAATSDGHLRGHDDVLTHHATDDANASLPLLVPDGVVGAPTDYYGIDISQGYHKSTFECLKGLNLKFAIIRCYESVGRVDPSCAGSAAAANAAGMDVHAYMFPCPTCGDPAGQVATLLKYWESYRVNVKRLWLDIEGAQYWHSSHSENQAFYKGLVEACAKQGLKCGVYSSESQWTPIFGSRDFSYGDKLPLWYADYDGEPSFSGWAHFGGWGAPTLKQFTDKGAKCGCSYDISWGPHLPE